MLAFSLRLSACPNNDECRSVFWEICCKTVIIFAVLFGAADSDLTHFYLLFFFSSSQLFDREAMAAATSTSTDTSQTHSER